MSVPFVKETFIFQTREFFRDRQFFYEKNMLENCRWLLYASRFYGCHPHTIDDERSSVPANFRLSLLAYSLIMCGLYCVAGYYAKGFRDYCNDTITMGCILQQTNRYSRCFYMTLTTLLSCLRHVEFERAVAVARKFDDLIRHHNSRCNDNKQTNCCIQWLIILTIFVAWIFNSILIILAVPHVILYALALQIITRITFSIEIAKFYFLYDALYRRFYRVNGLCRKLTGIISSINQQT